MHTIRSLSKISPVILPPGQDHCEKLYLAVVNLHSIAVLLTRSSQYLVGPVLRIKGAHSMVCNLQPCRYIVVGLRKTTIRSVVINLWEVPARCHLLVQRVRAGADIAGLSENSTLRLQT
jgi:hypothetical protein